MKMSDLVGKHKKESCFKEVYGEPPMVHGAFTYRCEAVKMNGVCGLR